jgi:hypothetical protein
MTGVVRNAATFGEVERILSAIPPLSWAETEPLFREQRFQAP